eukprot:11923761-Alexandrium_andersonii.AAC.1
MSNLEVHDDHVVITHHSALVDSGLRPNPVGLEDPPVDDPVPFPTRGLLWGQKSPTIGLSPGEERGFPRLTVPVAEHDN